VLVQQVDFVQHKDAGYRRQVKLGQRVFDRLDLRGSVGMAGVGDVQDDTGLRDLLQSRPEGGNERGR